MSIRIAVVYEADADFQTATELADRVLVETIDWLDHDLLPHQREWLKANTEGIPLKWKEIKKLASVAGIKTHGHFQGEAGFPDAAAARRAIGYLITTFSELDAIVLVRDQDDDPSRRMGLEQARTDDKSGKVIVIGFAIVEREAWVICGYEPASDEENDLLATERATIGFPPHLRSHELTACKDDQAINSPKRVLRALSSGDWQRERRCWFETPLELLHERGDKNGLAEYLGEIRTRLAPLIGHVAEG